MSAPDQEYITWLVESSMLEQASTLARRYTGKGSMWRHPYAEAQPRAAAALASVWFTAYPASIITRPGESVLATLGDDALWQAFGEIGIEALHSGPMKRSGGICGRDFTPTVDGNFDRIALEIDSSFGTTEQYAAMCRTASAHGGAVIDDNIPGHTGKGADFRLAEMAYGDYPGIYHMVEIDPLDWAWLPPVPPGADTVNLLPEVVDRLQQRGYIVGQLTRTIFYEPGVKETDWSVTDVVVGADGVERRWVYLHYFKEGQPSLNWLDPTFAAPRLVLGDALHSLEGLGARMLRLDANGFLGIEPREGERAWSEGHPLSLTANQLIAGLVRKLGGFTFQELNLTVDDIAAMSNGGPDLAYDFITRPAYHHALVTGDTSFLRLMLHEMHAHNVDPAGLIHALQNHDELTLELVHFWTLHKDDVYMFQNRQWLGSELREHIRAVMYARLSGDQAPYNLHFVENGIACTTASVIAASLGVRDLTTIGDAQVEQIKNIHLLLAMYNAFQPGVFALSGWDLTGALPLPGEAVEELMADGDTRWINRGAYDLMSVNPLAERSSELPKATALYGSLPEQFQQPDSFACRLKRMLEIRRKYRIDESRQVEIPDVESRSLLVLVHALPDGLGTQITALNFSSSPIEECVPIAGALPGIAMEMFSGESLDAVTEGGLLITLDGYEGKSYLLA